MWYIWKKLKLSITLFISFVCLALIWCGSGENYENQFTVNVAWYDLVYNWNVELWKVALMADDSNEIVDLYQEVWDDVWYRDSLLIAWKSAQWLWVNAFAQDNLDTLESQWLTISDIKKTQIKLENNSENIDAVLVDYKVTEWLAEEIPLLYVSQLFVQDGYNIKLISFVTEDTSSHSSAVRMLKNIN